jgi:Ca2+-dependent lipid-binding protein|tara:strand:- start:41 stop:442 length:402 start_codon:yes stop_codon:yes gene_type:complete
MELGEGLLTLKVEEGKLTRDTEMIGSMSPYCTMVFKGHKLKTKVHSYGGKTPVWGDEFVLDVLEHTEELVLRVWDQDTTTSDAIGWCKVKMSSLIINNGVEDWFTIMYDNKPTGDIKLTTKFEPVGGDAYEQL